MSDSDSKLAPWPFYADDEIAAATAVLRSGRVNYWTGGEGKAFEAEYAAHCKAAHGLAVANGTVALEMALQALGIGPGDEVIVPARTFIATAAAAALRGARPVVADIDPKSQNLTPETAAQVLSKRTKAVIVVHLAGWPADMTALMAFAATQNLKVIEDCAQAHGASELGRPVGGIGHIGCFSFCQDKIISTGGEGGMVVTSDITLYKKMWATRDHGKDFDRATTKSMAAESGPHFKWMVDSFGTNARMTEAQAAIGRLQLKKLPQWRAQRQANAAALTAALRGSNAVTVPQPDAQHVHAYYKFYALVTPGALKSGWSRDRICAELQRRGVPAGSGACPDISREAAFASFGAQAPHPGAAEIAERTLMLPVHPTLTRGNVAFMAETVRQILNEAAR